MPTEQAHPLAARDRLVIAHFSSTSHPSDQDITDAARLLNRYDGFPGCADIRASLIAAAKAWGFSNRDALNTRARSIWASGFRPLLDVRSEVGSGADVNTDATPQP